MIKISSAVPSSNESEKYVENFLNKKLSNDFECYIQPRIGDTNRADFVILNAKTRICVVIEIKHYNLHNNSLDEHKRIYLSAKSQIKTSQIKSLSKLAKIDTNKIIPCLLFYKATTEFARSICDENDDFKDSVFGDDMGELLSAYFVLAMKCGLNLDALYAIYVGKNVLNKFRQNHGYKDGSYKKTWNGVEDNEVLNEILKSELEKRYEALKA